MESPAATVLTEQVAGHCRWPNTALLNVSQGEIQMVATKLAAGDLLQDAVTDLGGCAIVGFVARNVDHLQVPASVAAAGLQAVSDVTLPLRPAEDEEHMLCAPSASSIMERVA